MEIDTKSNMECITKPSIQKLARRAAVKNVADDCYDATRDLINIKLNEIIKAALVVNSERNTKTLMVDDIIEGLHLIGDHIDMSDSLES